MGTFPDDFPVPEDQGGPGAGRPIGGFGGNPTADQAEHHGTVRRIGKAPVLLIHGNAGSADTGDWDMLDLNRRLLAAGYSPELIWAPSYLGPGPGQFDGTAPHTNNVGEVRDFIHNVCAYLDVDVVDVVAHSLGCSLIYAIGRGLERRPTPISWGQSKRWHRLGTFVALDGAFHGLSLFSQDEWGRNGEFMRELLTETEGGGGETPYTAGNPQTPSPTPHHITYFCGVARGGAIDIQNSGTGKLAGAVNKSYNLGSGWPAHRKIKEDQVVFDDFLPLLNSVPPGPPVKLTVDKDTGAYTSPLTATLAVEPTDLGVEVVARRLTKEFVTGAVVDKVLERREETLSHGQTITLATAGMWQATFRTAGAVDDLVRFYWVDVPEITVNIEPEADTTFDDSLLVMAMAADPTARLFHSLDGVLWTVGATVTITQDAAVSFIAINASGIASQVVTRSFRKSVRWDDVVTADALQHFLAGRIDATEYVSYSQQFGWFTPFALYLVAGEWVLDPDRPVRLRPPAAVRAVAETAAGARPVLRVTGGPEPGEYTGPVTVVIEAVDAEEPVTVFYTRDGSIPDSGSASFTGRGQFELTEAGNHGIACYARDSDGNENYQVFHYSLTR
jgi:pimeloyl-ACP methyl ester carboxylesterase